MSINSLGSRLALLAVLCAPVYATVTITSMTPSVNSPQSIGASITWTVTAQDSTPSNQLTFQFNVAPPRGSLALVKDFNSGSLSGRTWTSQPFVWVPTGIQGLYQIQVVVKDFTTGQSASKLVTYQVNPLVQGTTPVAVKTGNALVALFSAPSCPAGSTMRVSFQMQSKTRPPTYTNYVPCQLGSTMTFEIAGMYPLTAYNMFSQTNTNGVITNGPSVTFTTGGLPPKIPMPPFTIPVPVSSQTDTTDGVFLIDPVTFGGGTNYADVATDLNANIIWYYYASPPQGIVMTRPLSNGTILSIQTGQTWSKYTDRQLLRQVDLAGNIVRETNTGIISQELLALGATDAAPCNTIPSPAPVGSACLDGFNHEAIQLPNGYTVAQLDIEKIFQAGTQGDTSGLPVDIIGNMIVVLDTNWQAVWYFDAFQHDGGAPQLDINRAAVLNETCSVGQQDCPVFLLGPGISPTGRDWLHGNSIYYQASSGDFLWSVRHQDWVTKIDYQNGAGTGNILWRSGPCGDFSFNNIYNDAWPWFSHQHEVDIESATGFLTLFDNGNTRVSPPSGAGSSTGCIKGVGSGNSRGMALKVSESTMQVTPVLSDDLGVYSNGDGSAQYLSDGHYFFLAGYVLVSLTVQNSYAIEVVPTAGTDTGTQVLNIQGPGAYRGWRMPNLYNPPTT